jgi:hypothetical protein
MRMHVNKGITIAQVAKDLGEDEDWIRDVANEMEIATAPLGLVSRRRRPGVHRRWHRESENLSGYTMKVRNY